jgi:colicin import membrane protein
MTTSETNATDKAATVAAQGAHVAPEKASAKKGAPKAKKAANGAKQGAKANATAPKKAAKGGAKASKKATKLARNAAAPRAESKGAKILEMIARAKGATLAEIMKGTDWQAHSVREFISTAGKKHGVKIESAKSESGERVYRSAK